MLLATAILSVHVTQLNYFYICYQIGVPFLGR